MDTLFQADNISNDVQQHFEGKRFYHPGVLAAYCILANIPLATFLYGINVHRRGNARFGNVIKVMAALAIVAMTIAYPFGSNLSGTRLMLPGIVIGIGLMKAERSNYEKAISKGASPEKWWPPLLFLLVNVLITELIHYFFVSE